MSLKVIGTTWRRCGDVELARGLTAGTRLSPPSRQNVGGGAISDSSSGTDGVMANACALWTLWTHRIYGHASHPSRASSAPLPRHNAKPVMPIGSVALSMRRCGGAAVRRCRASARTYGWDTLEPFITIKLGGRRYFAMSGHAGRLCVRGFLRLGSYTDLCAVKNDNGNGRPACPER